MSEDTDFEKWRQTMDEAFRHPLRDQYDDLLKREIVQYNNRFKGTPGYLMVDWQLFKAILFVESGGPAHPSNAWNTRAFQIGNKGDPGLDALRSGEEASLLVMDTQLMEDIKGDVDRPELNIRAGIAYIFTRMALTELVAEVQDTTIYSYTCTPTDRTMWDIANDLGTTADELLARNGNDSIIKPGRVLKYRKVKNVRKIAGWRTFDEFNIAKYYNSMKKDKRYDKKLIYVRGKMRIGMGDVKMWEWRLQNTPGVGMGDVKMAEREQQ
jgi:hypothetical protein